MDIIPITSDGIVGIQNDPHLETALPISRSLLLCTRWNNIFMTTEMASGIPHRDGSINGYQNPDIGT